ncbi:MAG: DNA-binding transcriptional regulator OxyR [Gammaproteobacteria bacterium]|nr:DNA-binding transcriptional regulator OxyR [Gammaproteobacteria bacterium]
MNLRELQYLVALDEERHFRKAAERCFVSQPTLSGQLKKLEEELGVLLVERTKRQVIMTDVGTVIAEHSRQILSQVKNLHEIAQSYQDPMAGELHVGLIPTVAPYLLPHIMPQIKKDFPQLKLWLHEYQTDILLEKLRRAEIDVLILALLDDHSDFKKLELFDEAFQLALPRNNKLAKQKNITLNDLNNQKMLLLEEGHCLRGQALDVCYLAGAKENINFHASSLETLRHMVGEDMGMTLIPQLAVPTKHKARDPVQYIAFAEPQPGRRIGMLYRKGSYREVMFKKLQQMIKQSVATTLAS